MTGYSRIETSENGVTALVEIRTVNGKNLDISPRIPKSLQHKEIDIREMIRHALMRGSVSVNVTVETVSEESHLVTLNEEKAAAYFAEIDKLRKKFKMRDAVKLDHLMNFTDMFEKNVIEEDYSKQWNIVQKTLRSALISLDNMRKNEGRELGKDIRARIGNIERDLDKVEKLAEKRVPVERERLRARIAQLFESDEIDEQRLQMEIIIVANKLDISEEIVRLRSHIKFAVEVMNSKGHESIGRRLNFILQEMHREINTIGSKADDAGISQIVVAMKEELERLREQVQNIE
ncbi:MAG TPA: YicC/YloC family endoribonuclease [Patescibacteria group bacterium]|nr:YicC/YloC family endoribonuclease [Patescibacteria group bacterium]